MSKALDEALGCLEDAEGFLAQLIEEEEESLSDDEWSVLFLAHNSVKVALKNLTEQFDRH